MTQRIVFLCLFLLLSWTLPLQADVFKCVDTQGQVLYADAPCEAGVSSQSISTKELSARTTVLKSFAPPPATTTPQTQTLPQQQATSSYAKGLKSMPRAYELLALLGMVIFVVGGIAFLVDAFRTHLAWGFGCLLIPLVGLIFLILYWQDVKKPFFTQLLGIALLLVAAWMGAGQYHW